MTWIYVHIIACSLISIKEYIGWDYILREQSIKKLNFFVFNLLLHIQLNQICLLQSTPIRSWYTTPNVFSSSEMRPGTCFAGWPEGPVSNFLLSPLPSEIGHLLVRILASVTRKSPQGPNLESRAAMERSNSPWLTVTRLSFRAPVSRRGKNFAASDASSVFRSKSGGTNFYRCLLLRQLHGQLGDDFDESQQALSQRDRRPLTWKAVQIWGRLRWTFCPIWNAGTIREIAYGSNSPLHKPVATSENPP